MYVIRIRVPPKQEETEVLRQALAEKSDYRLAQCSMDRLDGLKSVLWEAHAAEARTAGHLETLELQVQRVVVDRTGNIETV